MNETGKERKRGKKREGKKKEKEKKEISPAVARLWCPLFVGVFGKRRRKRKKEGKTNAEIKPPTAHRIMPSAGGKERGRRKKGKKESVVELSFHRLCRLESRSQGEVKEIGEKEKSRITATQISLSSSRSP